MLRRLTVVICGICMANLAAAQERGIINNGESPHVKLRSINIGDCRWTSGFRDDKFELCEEVMVPHMGTLLKGDRGHAYNNFKVTAGLKEGKHQGMHWHDGDFYKWMESAMYVYAVNKDPEILNELDGIIGVIGKAQEEDGYLSTQIQLSDIPRLSNRQYHELYNSGHLITSACIHHRVTGQRNFLDIAIKHANYLYQTFQPQPKELARFGFNQTQVMGLVELYRTTGNKEYLHLAEIFINMRGRSKPEPDDIVRYKMVGDMVQERTPLRKSSEAVGHAVLALYFYAGAADVYAETGEQALIDALDRLWNNVVQKKMYVTGACGQSHHGSSSKVDFVHEAFIDEYMMPNLTAYNETCANICSAMFSHRMLLLTSTVALHAADGANAPASSSSSTEGMWSHIECVEDLGELRNMNAQWDASAPDGVLKLVAERRASYAWAVTPAPKEGWDLARRANVVAEVTNRGTVPAAVLLWVVGDRGWDAVVDSATLAPGESRKFSCGLRTSFPDGTPKIDPGQIKQVQVMLRSPKQDAAIEVRGLAAAGDAPEWKRPPRRMDVPVTEDVPPAPGRRVRYRLAGDEDTGIYSVLHLPVDWKPGDAFPVIVEYPGNIFFTPACYSTGLPDQCVIGYGITKGKRAICVSLPFVDRKTGTMAENSWGNADDTADYAVSMVDEICANFGGDRKNVVLTGFSRGALACGYIGLRNERIASLWKGFHACQHYDGDGWHGATMESAMERAKRFQGKAVFQTDNSTEKFQPLMNAMKAETTYVRSGLGAHACAMFLDDRPSTQQLRKWFADLVAVQGKSR